MLKEGIFGHKFRCYCFLHESLQFGKFENADFKFENSFLKVLAQKYPNKAFFCPKFSHFSYFTKTFQLEQFESADIK